MANVPRPHNEKARRTPGFFVTQDPTLPNPVNRPD